MEHAGVCVTCTGYVGSSEDAYLLLDACLRGFLPQVPRRLKDDEQKSLVKSGSVFIYNENASNIKRWTDGRSCSPRSRLGEFYIYYELEGKKGSMPKDAGLLRKTIGLTRDGITYRLVSYFTEVDVQEGVLAAASLCIQSEICWGTNADSQHSEGICDQSSNQLAMCLASDSDLMWEVNHPWLDWNTTFNFDEEQWPGLSYENGVNLVSFENFGD